MAGKMRVRLMAVAVAAALLAGCGGDESVSAEAEWAERVCGPFAEWQEELRSLGADLQGSSDPVGALRDAGARAEEATDALLRELEDAGAPPDGAPAAYDGLLSGIRAARGALESQLDAVGTLAPGQAAAALGLVATQVDGVLEGLESSLDAVRTSTEELERGFADAESCSGLGAGSP
jgi:hypothetical protein